MQPYSYSFVCIIVLVTSDNSMNIKLKVITISLVLLASLSVKSYGQQKPLAGPSDTLVVLWSSGDPEVALLQKSGVMLQACIGCSNMYGVTDTLKVCQVDVKGMGVPLTMYLKRGYRVVSY